MEIKHTDWDKECELLKEYLKDSVEFLPSVVIYTLKEKGIIWIRSHTTFSEWKRDNKWRTNWKPKIK